MITGKGTLKLRLAGRIAVRYEFSDDCDDARVGYLLCDTTAVDPTAFCDRLRLECDDGSELTVAVTNVSDRHLSVVGRVLHGRDRLAA